MMTSLRWWTMLIGEETLTGRGEDGVMMTSSRWWTMMVGMEMFTA